jgi:hypothetical protein
VLRACNHASPAFDIGALLAFSKDDLSVSNKGAFEGSSKGAFDGFSKGAL